MLQHEMRYTATGKMIGGDPVNAEAEILHIQTTLSELLEAYSYPILAYELAKLAQELADADEDVDK